MRALISSDSALPRYWTLNCHTLGWSGSEAVDILLDARGLGLAEARAEQLGNLPQDPACVLRVKARRDPYRIRRLGCGTQKIDDE